VQGRTKVFAHENIAGDEMIIEPVAKRLLRQKDGKKLAIGCYFALRRRQVDERQATQSSAVLQTGRY